MKSLWKIAADDLHLFDFKFSKSIKIHDPMLGLSVIALKLAIILYFLMLAWNDVLYSTEVPTLRTSYWADAELASLLQAQARDQPYCQNQTYDYGNQYCTMFSSNTSCTAENCNGVWCETNVGCASLSPWGEIARRGPDEMQYTTVVKNILTNVEECDTNTSMPSVQNKKGDCEATGGVFGSADGLGLCECTKTRNLFVKGVEQMLISFSHTFILSTIALPKGVNPTNVKTKLFRVSGDHHSKTAAQKYSDSKLVRTYPADKPISISIAQLLDDLGMSLDDENVEAGAQGGGEKMASWMAEPRYRTTGVAIKLKLEYLANDGKAAGKVYVDGSADITCFITAEVTGGWQPFGSVISYHDRANYTNRQDFPKYRKGDGEVEQVSFTDRYERGVHISFEGLGEVGKFDPLNAVVWFTQLTVLLAFCPLFVSLIAFNLIGYKSAVYRNKAKERVDVVREHAKMAANVLAASTTFQAFKKALRGGDDTMTSIDQAELLTLFTNAGVEKLTNNPHAAELLTVLISKELEIQREPDEPEDEAAKMTFGKWVDLLTEDVAELDKMLDRASGGDGGQPKRGGDSKAGNEHGAATSCGGCFGGGSKGAVETGGVNQPAGGLSRSGGEEPDLEADGAAKKKGGGKVDAVQPVMPTTREGGKSPRGSQ